MSSVKRQSGRGSSILEFALTLPLIFGLAGLGIYMSLAMRAKQEALVKVRHSLFAHKGWSGMKLEDWAPDGAGAVPDGSRPRGSGPELDRLKPMVEPPTLDRVDHPSAEDYWDRIWGNLPGRYDVKKSKRFHSEGSMWNVIPHTAHAQFRGDTAEWRWHHIQGWKIARSGPLKPVYDSFRNNLEGKPVPEHFRRTRDDIINRWFHRDGRDNHWWWEDPHQW